jgi:hypothetical protein
MRTLLVLSAVRLAVRSPRPARENSKPLWPGPTPAAAQRHGIVGELNDPALLISMEILSAAISEILWNDARHYYAHVCLRASAGLTRAHVFIENQVVHDITEA